MAQNKEARLGFYESYHWQKELAEHPEKYSVGSRWVYLRKRATPRHHTDEEKAIVLATYAICPELGQKRIASIFGIKRTTLRDWGLGKFISDEALAMADDYKERIKTKLETVLEMALDAMPDKVDKASFWDLARTSGLAFDKLQLIEGKPTSINGAELPTAERTRMILGLMEQAKQRQQEAQIIDITPVESMEDCVSPLEASNADANEWEPI